MRTAIELFLFFFGIPAFFFVAMQAPDYIENWLSADERAELKELYSIIGDQEVSKIATKYISGSVVCTDSFNDSELPMEFEKVWVRAQDNIEEAPFKSDLLLSTGWDSWGKNGFSKEVPPQSCDIKNEQLSAPVILNQMQSVTATCERTAKVSQIVRQTIDTRFWIRSESGDYLDGAYVDIDYDVTCDLVVTKIKDCLPRDYGNKQRVSLPHEYYFGAFTEYNYCDNPENSEFKRQVFDKWERSRKLKESDDE